MSGLSSDRKPPPDNPSKKKFYPTVEECKLRKHVKCPEEGCQNVFTSESNLNLHLAKTHKKNYLLEKDTASKQYYCPIRDCVYSKDKFFKNIKHLRQHFMKVHAAKCSLCTECGNYFASDSILKRHAEYCGINFICCDCKASYPCYETLKTHGRRKEHKILKKNEYKSKVLSVMPQSAHVGSDGNNRIILPKPSSHLLNVPVANKITSNQKIQTDREIQKINKKCSQGSSEIMLGLQNSRETQTVSDNIQSSIETQTTGDYLNFANKNADILVSTSNLSKNSNTQTDIIKSTTTSCNTSFNLEDFQFSLECNVKTNSLGTQTIQNTTDQIYSTIATTHDSVNDTTDPINETLGENISNFEFFNCNMETQTDFSLENDLFSCDYYMNNMFTQTCEEILNDWGFSDIQTQTVIDDVLRSVESQTTMSRAAKMDICKVKSNMETQTDMGFMQMLESIHS